MKVDFHSHTYESDGSLSPQELADFMQASGVEVYSISDHDTLTAYGNFEPAPGARVVPGIEINTSYRQNEVHVLGYGSALLHDAAVATMLEHNRAERRKRVERMVAQLRRGGYGITMADVEREGPNAKALGRPHVGKALIRAGHAGDIEAAFRNFLRGGKLGYVPSTHVTPHEAIETIGAAGGIAVLAHPGRLRDRAIIDELAPHGLRGLEAFYPRHDAGEVRFFREKAAELGLFVTGGADFHDIRYHTRGVGIDVPDDAIAPFIEDAFAA